METKINSTPRDGGKEGADISNSMLRGRILANPLPGEEVVITGVAGVFPDANDVHELRDKLFNKINMVLPNRRYVFTHPEMPLCYGTLSVLDEYDAGFFGVHARQAASLDVQNRLLQERTIEAILDAGLHPSDLENTRTGVFVGITGNDSQTPSHHDGLVSQQYAITGSMRSTIANRLSYFLKLKGPSCMIDTACSSSLAAIDDAFAAIRAGEIDNAIVAATNLCVNSLVVLQFARLGVLSPDGSCKSFDNSANGFARAEAVAVFILQKQNNAKRVYAQIVHAKVNCDGYKEQGITYPSKEAQTNLLKELYAECCIDPSSISYLEAHGTGTVIGDPIECATIDDIFTRNRKKPLLIGSVKSNIGHAEAAAGICSVIKCIIAMETGFIPPNIHFNVPRKEITALKEGRLKVVTEKTPFEDSKVLTGVSALGFGGVNTHLLLRWNKKDKVNKGIPQDDLPRLVCVSGRTKNAVVTLLEELRDNTFDSEHIKLLQDGFRKPILNHLYRGYSIISKSGQVDRSFKCYSGNFATLYLVFGEVNWWHDVANELMSLPIFAETIQRIQEKLTECKINITDLILNTPAKNQNHILGSTSLQIGFINMLRTLEIIPKYSFGYSYGQLVSAYNNKIITLDETIDCALIMDEIINNWHNNNGCVKIKKNKRKIPDTTVDILRADLLIHGSGKRAQLLKKLIDILTSTKDEGFERADIAKNSTILQLGTIPVVDIPEDTTFISTFSKQNGSYIVEILKVLGSLYENGFNTQLTKLYPAVKLPVSRGTRMISPYIKWKHDRKWFVAMVKEPSYKKEKNGHTIFNISLSDNEWTYLAGHTIDGKVLFPATGYLYLVWQTFAMMTSTQLDAVNMVFENCKFMRPAHMHKSKTLVLSVAIQRKTGNFEIDEDNTPLVTGKIYSFERYEPEIPNYQPTCTLSTKALPLTTTDIYKELRLRGYNYKGEFRAIQKCDNDACTGYIKWKGNWVAFLDNMLQMKILQTDSRELYVPTHIAKVIIPVKSHLEWIKKKYGCLEKPVDLQVFSDPLTGTVSCGKIRFCGLLANSIAKRRDANIPVLESYTFVPNIASLQLEQSVRVNIQIILENALIYKVKCVELVEECTKPAEILLTPIVKTVLEDIPLVTPFLKILSKTPVDVAVEVEDKNLSNETDCLIVIATNVLGRPKVLKEAFYALKENGYIISREPCEADVSNFNHPDVKVLTLHRTPNEYLLLLQRISRVKELVPFKLTTGNKFQWISELQETFKKFSKTEDILVYSENESRSGIIGFVNCLRREPDSANVRCVFIMHENKKFSVDDSLYADQLKKNMAINVYKNGEWGTYRHLTLNLLESVKSEHCFVRATIRGDMSSLRWIEGPLTHVSKAVGCKLIHVYYAALNFRDIMTTSGKISPDAITRDRREQECVQGVEFSGRDEKGNRVMGMAAQGALSTLVLTSSDLIINVPDSWSLEEAATVPVVYLTVIYAFYVVSQLKRGETILIHSGTGGVGQAAIRLALNLGCKVYTTVSTSAKRSFLKETFPQLKDQQIGNSHDESFEQMIYKETKGRGVDAVLNSLADNKLLASVRCLAKGGKLLEIGKFDLIMNSQLNVSLFNKNASFHGVMLDNMFYDPYLKNYLVKLMKDLIQREVIKPLNRKIFNKNETEEAFRFMASGKHMGKILIKVREPEERIVSLPRNEKFKCVPRYLCNSQKVYIIVGGLGGFGLELADWLVLRGATKLVLTSRQGIANGYQQYRIRIWQSYGVTIKISKADITTMAGCKNLIEESQELGPISAIFNLAVVLKDSIFENQTADSFLTAYEPKALATQFLDELTRKLCPDLSQFVVFSSVSCGRGNPGQTNYGMANSVMERICENRRQDGYPALAIEWGAIGEVGIVAKMQERGDLIVGGTIQQRISNCLKVLDCLLRQNDQVIVSSMVVAEKRETRADNIVDAVINILGLSGSKSISPYSTLPEIGMDSMNGLEVKQTLETDFNIVLTVKELRTMTLAMLKELEVEKDREQDGVVTQDETQSTPNIIMRIAEAESECRMPKIRLKSHVDEEKPAATLLVFPGLEGFAGSFDKLAARLKVHVICLQYVYDKEEESVIDTANSLLPHVEECLTKNEPFNIVAHSFGTMVALEVVNILESKGYIGKIMFLDGTPKLVKKMLIDLNFESEAFFQTTMAWQGLSLYLPSQEFSKYKKDILQCKSREERIDLCVKLSNPKSASNAHYRKMSLNAVYARSRAAWCYNPSFSKLKSKAKLCISKQTIMTGLAKDHDLSLLFESPVEVQTFEGTHYTFIENELLSDAINTFICDDTQN